ncbi:hypothetical protein [Nocardia asteroides]|uniref:hypothetical protein n=1 Tax=Nocardia asteroides TaxID=1824 RepID=UPI0033FBC385
MRTNHSTIDTAVQELDLVADMLSDEAAPHWQATRTQFGYRVVVFLPRRYSACDQTRASVSGDFCTVESAAPILVDAMNAMIGLLREIPIGWSVLDVLAVEAAL